MEKCFFNDTATTKDSLGFKPYVEAIAEFLTTKYTKPPITLSIEGQWGCGKSSFMKQLKDRIEKLNEDQVEKTKDNSHLDSKNKSKKQKIRSLNIRFLYKRRKSYSTVWFNCWRYEKEDELWAAFALSLIEQLSRDLLWYQRLWARLKLTCLRLKFKFKGKSSFSLNICLFFLFFCFSIAYSVPKFYEVVSSQSKDGLLGNLLVILIGFLGPIVPFFYFGKDLKDAIGNPLDFSKFISSPNYEEHISFIEQFHSDFNKIVESYAGDSSVYVFIDDLDRCEISKAAELVQAINLMISEEAKIFFCIGMDRKIISAGLAAKNENICKYISNDKFEHGLEYGYNFIEKFIQVPFKVPSPKNNDFKELFNCLREQESSSKDSLSDKNLLQQLRFSLDSSYKLFLNKSGEKDDRPKHINQKIKASQPENTNQKIKNYRIDDEEISLEEEKISNYLDCYERSESDELSEAFKCILEMVAPALDYNPRRMKQFLNLFRFQRTIGLQTGLFTYKKEAARNQMWNCKKLAKFIVIYIKWPSIILALNSNAKYLEELQTYALKPQNRTKDLDPWIEDEKLVELLKYGCIENDPQKEAEYTFLGLDFSKLLEISPVVLDPGSIQNLEPRELPIINGTQEPERRDHFIIYVAISNYKCPSWSKEHYPLINLFGENYVPLLSSNNSVWQSHVNMLAQLVIDSKDKYTLRTGEKLDLGQGYFLEVKQVDVDGKKTWLQFDKDDNYINDAIISTDTGNSTWTCKLDNIQGENDVSVLKVHVKEVFQGSVDSIVQIDGLWLIDYANIKTLEIGGKIGEFTLIEIVNGVNEYNLGGLVFKK